MSKRAEEAALKAYPVANTWSPFGPLPVDQNEVARYRYRQGYEQAEKDIIAIIESRIAEILGDAQPKPTIRIELKELITRIKEEKK